MTDNHQYNTPSKGTADWHIPLNDNFQKLDTDVEIRGLEADLNNFDAKTNAKYFATDTENIYFGDGNSWVKADSSGLDPRFGDVSSRSVNGVVNLKQWRDDGGFGDIGAAFNDAANWLATNKGGGTVYTPEGNYSLTTTINWDASNVGAPIRWLGAGWDATSITVQAGHQSIKMADLTRDMVPEIGHMRFSVGSLAAGEEAIAAGPRDSDNDGPTLPVFNRIRMSGSGEQIGIKQTGYWFKTFACRFNDVIYEAGVQGKNRGNRAEHFGTQFENSAGDRPYDAIDGASKHYFVNCKMVGGTESGRFYDKQHVFMGVDTELSGGPINIRDNTDGCLIVNTPVDPSEKSVVIGPGLSGSFPASGYHFSGNSWEESLTDGQPPWGRSPTQDGADPRNADMGTWHRIREGHFDEVGETEIFSFRGVIPDGWTEDHTGSGSAIVDDGVVLSTGTTQNDIARLDMNGDRWLKMDKHPALFFYVETIDASDVRISMGFENGPNNEVRQCRYDTGAGDTEWTYAFGGSTTSANNRAPGSSLNFVIPVAFVPQAITGSRDELGGVVHELGGAGGSAAKANPSGSHTTVDFQPFIEIETLSATDKRIRVKGIRSVQRYTPGSF